MGHPKVYFKSLEEYNLHFQENHSEICKEQICDKCEKIFSTYRLLKLHKLKDHGVKVPSTWQKKSFIKGALSCTTGHKQIYFPTIADLNDHVIKEHNGNDKEYFCEKCPQGFCLPRILDLHYSSEHDEQR